MKRLITRIANFLTNFLPSYSDLVSSLNDRSSYRPAGCNNILGLLLHLCDGDENLRTWVLRWIAFQLRNPGAKMSTAIVVNGSRFGKGIFFEDVLSCLFGSASYTIVSDELHSLSMRWATQPINLVTVHGVFSPRNVSRLRALVSSTSLIIERRGKAPETRPNKMNFVFLTTAFDFLPEQSDVGRRFVILETPPEWPRRYYEAVQHEVNAGGIGALREYLHLHLDMGTFNERTLPPAPAFRNQKEAA